MPSSIKMIKASKVYGGASSAKIDTQVELPLEKTPTKENIHLAETDGNKAQEQSEFQLEQVKLEVEKLKEEAKIEIESLRQTTYQEALVHGEEAGYQEGFNKGLTDGLAEATSRNEELRASIMMMLKQAQAEVERYQEDKKQELIELASHMAEKIVQDTLDASDEGLLKIVTPLLYQLDKNEEFVSITTHPEQSIKLKEQLPAIEAISPATRFLVFSDPSLEKNGLIIESSRAVIDLQIKKQLDAMLRRFDEMERTVHD